MISDEDWALLDSLRGVARRIAGDLARLPRHRVMAEAELRADDAASSICRGCPEAEPSIRRALVEYVRRIAFH